MNEYATPVNYLQEISHKDGQQSRNGDWICIKCNNLNFSFRKKCNRCRQQTKEENQNHLISAYQLYYQYYSQDLQQAVQQPTIDAISAQNTDAIQQKKLLSPAPRFKKIRAIQKQLPSVSPLLKRYNSSRTNKKKNCSTQKYLYNSDSWQNQCLSQYSSASDNQSSNQHRQERNQDLERILQNIFI